MRVLTAFKVLAWPASAWYTTAVVGVLAPVLLVLALPAVSAPLALASGPIFTLALMGVGIISAATMGRFWAGGALALLNAACLLGVFIGDASPRAPDFSGSCYGYSQCKFHGTRRAVFQNPSR